MSDYENALQGALADIFPEADILGCWFHFSQVRIGWVYVTAVAPATTGLCRFHAHSASAYETRTSSETAPRMPIFFTLSKTAPTLGSLYILFALFQAVFKHMMIYELSVCFKECEEFGLWFQLTMALPLLPTNRIEEAWSQLKIYPVNVPQDYIGKFKVISYFFVVHS